ncbi:MAG: hypothetical protein EXS16_18650 [Gemmataceae bacterium]|nr:hypothetical protein [Gemmataceae bacterium]
MALDVFVGRVLFYGSVDVKIGSSVLDSDFQQGFITRHVTLAINITGVVVLLAWMWEMTNNKNLN